jgi:hypothetical protein
MAWLSFCPTRAPKASHGVERPAVLLRKIDKRLRRVFGTPAGAH